MTMVDTLFGLVPAASTGQQWVARDLQLVNWGVYDGHQVVRFASTATLLSGASGSGKSTLLDAYIALLMPHTTPFNGASNGGVVGRPRGKDQRNVISYARGKLDESRTEGGTRERVLRGDGQDTWSAISMTWTDQTGTAFTALRAWYVPRTARGMDELVAVRATLDGELDVRALEASAAQRFARPGLIALGLTCFDTDKEFTARLHSVLGIGAAGGGSKAVGLLSRIQAGQQITTVDALYKAMVLEEPETLAKADQVVEHFDDLASTRTQMLTAQAQVRALRPIRQHRAAVETACERLVVIDELGDLSSAHGPAALWRYESRLDLLRSVEDEVRQAHRAAAAEVRSLDASHQARKAELEGVKQTLYAAGGDKIAAAARELEGANAALAAAGKARGRLDLALEVLGTTVSTGADFERCRAASRAALDGETGTRATLRNELHGAYDRASSTRRELEQLESEHQALGRRHGNVPEALHQTRLALAHAAGLTAEELPFVAELVEVRAEYEPWREAFNLALGGFATTLLVDVDRLADFRRAIDGVPSRTRLRFEGVSTGLPVDVGYDERTMSGRLDLKRGPFAGWLAARLATSYDYVCVDAAADLGRHRRALTSAGQTSDGDRGAHGGQGRGNVLGFTNSRRLAELERQIVTAREAARLAAEAQYGAEARRDALEEKLRAHGVVVELTWDEIDVAAARDAVARWAQVATDARAGNADVVALQERAEALDRDVDGLFQQLTLRGDERDRLRERWSSLSDAVDGAQAAVDAAQEAGTQVSDAHRAYLQSLLPADDEGEASDPAAALARFDASIDRVADKLDHDRDQANSAVAAGRDALRTIFESFVRQWPNPDLGTDPEKSYTDFDRTLATLESDRLHELAEKWRRSLLRLSGADLTDLDNSMSSAVREIEERIAPVNEILAELPFADDDHRLSIMARRTQSAVVARFRKDLRGVRTLLAPDATDAEREARYARMERVIDRIRRTSPDFADLVDVRRHVRLEAEKVDLDGHHVAVYDHIGEKSGGESQELVAFIVGAALRYQLGDAGAGRPRYAPVFLDEALIKADARFTGRAVGAWRGLGFQLVIGAPLDKVSALEPHVAASYVVVKGADGRARARAVVGADEIDTGGASPGDDETSGVP
ncbi:ATP-binding protein [Isoptericola croceus]|uniref:ATP-binding protein n=1 Tax=Isoptericola croceus TaxID=3031406 RepID=UPI0023F90AEA|nr:SbcC/MukB-like Walker B domain-containing protein [Isoptericola croceus]